MGFKWILVMAALLQIATVQSSSCFSNWTSPQKYLTDDVDAVHQLEWNCTDVSLPTSPGKILPMRLEMSLSTRIERALLGPAVVALVVVLGVFFRILVQEMSLSKDQVSMVTVKSVSRQSSRGRQNSSLPVSPAKVLTRTNSSRMGQGRLKSSSVEPKLGLSTGDGTGSEDFKAGMARPKGFPGLRVRIPQPSALNVQKSTLGSPLPRNSSPSSTQFWKGRTEKGNQVRFDGFQSKISPESSEERLPSPRKQSPSTPKTPTSTATRNRLMATKAISDGGSSPLESVLSPIKSDLAFRPEIARSPSGKGSPLSQIRQVVSPKSGPTSPKSNPPLLTAGANVNDIKKDWRKKGRNSPMNTTSSPLARLDVTVQRHNLSPHAGTGISKGTSGLLGSRSDSLYVASPDLPKIEQVKAIDLNSWTSSQDLNWSIEKGNEGSIGKRGVLKDWATIARKPANSDSSGLLFTPSVTIPTGEDLGSELGFAAGMGNVKEPMKSIFSSPTSVLVSTMSPSGQAPRAMSAKGVVRRPEGKYNPIVTRSLGEMFCREGDGISSPTSVLVSTISPTAQAPRASGTKGVVGGPEGKYNPIGTRSLGDMFCRERDGSPRILSEIDAEDQRMYDLWGHHFGEILRSPTHQIGPVASRSPPQTPDVSNFSSSPRPGLPRIDRSLPSMSSQALDDEKFCLSSNLYYSLKSDLSIPINYTDVGVSNHLGDGRNSLTGYKAGVGPYSPHLGISSSPRNLRGPYSPHLGPRTPPKANELVIRYY